MLETGILLAFQCLLLEGLLQAASHSLCKVSGLEEGWCFFFCFQKLEKNEYRSGRKCKDRYVFIIIDETVVIFPSNSWYSIRTQEAPA